MRATIVLGTVKVWGVGEYEYTATMALDDGANGYDLWLYVASNATDSELATAMIDAGKAALDQYSIPYTANDQFIPRGYRS